MVNPEMLRNLYPGQQTQNNLLKVDLRALTTKHRRNLMHLWGQSFTSGVQFRQTRTKNGSRSGAPIPGSLATYNGMSLSKRSRLSLPQFLIYKTGSLHDHLAHRWEDRWGGAEADPKTMLSTCLLPILSPQLSPIIWCQVTSKLARWSQACDSISPQSYIQHFLPWILTTWSSVISLKYM